MPPPVPPPNPERNPARCGYYLWVAFISLIAFNRVATI